VSEPIRVGVIGVGHIGRQHARIFASLGDATLVGIYDLDAARAREVSQGLGVRSFESLEGLVSEIEAASVATPTRTHFEIASFLLDQGRHVLVEKPVCDNVQDARRLLETAQGKGLILQVGHVERFNPIFRVLRDLLNGPRFIEAHRLHPYPGRNTEVGVVLDLMIHDLDIILELVAQPIVKVEAVGVPILSATEDIANARLRFANGCIANVTTSRVSREKMRKIRVFQPDAYLSLNYEEQSGELYRREKDRILREPIPISKEEPLRLELSSFLRCVRERTNPVVGATEALAALRVAVEITEEIQRSSPLPS
jgi:predicted dehydrogenase